MKENHFIRMALNNAWANSTIYEDLNTLKKNEFWAERPGFFGSLGRTMNHIYEVDLYYVDALTEGGKGERVAICEEGAGLAAGEVQRPLSAPRQFE